MKNDMSVPSEEQQFTKNGNKVKTFFSRGLSSKKLSSRLALIIGGVLTLLFIILIIATASLTQRSIGTAVTAELSEISASNANQVQSVFNTATAAATDMQQYLEKCYQRAQENPEDNEVPTTAEARAMCGSVIYDKTILSAINYDAEQFMSETARSTAVNNEAISAMGVFYEPRGFQKDLKEYSIYVTEDQANEEINPYDQPYSQYSQEDYYKLAVENKDTIVTDPYDFNGVQMMTVGAPIIYKDQIKGVICGDIYLKSFDKIKATNDRYPSMYATVYNSNGTIVYDTESADDIGKNLADFTPKKDELSLVQGNMAKGKAFNVETTREDGRKVTRHFTPIQAGVDTWWALTAVNSSEANKAVTQSVILLIAFSLVALIIIIVVVVVVLRRKLKPMQDVVAAAEGVAMGNLDVDIEIKSEDEIGTMSKAFMEMSKRLKEIIADTGYLLGEMADGNFNVAPKHRESYVGEYQALLTSMERINKNLSDTLFQINQAADQVSSGSEQVSAGSQELSQGATEQASSVEELAATINEISAQVRATAENSSDAKEKAIATGTELQHCNEQMTEMTAAMAEINESSAQIGKIIKTIEDIAFQTNILALNAAVEAARAGEAGKGFAVVADEVRNLASKSAEASKNTASLIDNATHSVDKGIGIAEETAESLSSVVSSSADIKDAVENISSAAVEQSDAISQVSQGVDQISAVVQNNSATAEESAAASEELSGQAQMLKDLVGRFKLRE